ncbi:MAG: DUF4336 domain-containing protein [Cyanobacteria bacterium]|nr:DUF4336 domain-containing protein [Cyanobacteriota bacterium]
MTTPSTPATPVTAKSQPGDWRWPFWPIVPLYPYGRRRTLCREVVPETIWTFEQVQGIFYVVVPIRMTVVRLAQGGLLVYAPVAPTPECVQLMRQLEARYGAVRYILLTTATGIEHKVFVGPFARCFPQAQVYSAPHQWSYPLNLPLPWLGLPRQRTQILPAEASQTPFAAEFDYAILGPISLGLGPFAEVALFHRPTRTLLLTDTLVKVPADPPAVLGLDPYPLLFHSRDRATDTIIDSPDHRRRGWQRIALFAFYFQPAALGVPTLIEAIREAGKARDRSRQAYWGLYPFRWQDNWQDSFMALHGEGRPFVAPVLQTLIFSRGPEQITQWLTQVTRWQFEQVIPCHLEAPFPFTPSQLQQAFGFLNIGSIGADALTEASPRTQADFAFLRELETGLIKRGITPPRPNPPS